MVKELVHDPVLLGARSEPATPEDLQVIMAEEPPAENAPHIEFKNVSFSYTGVGKNIDNLSFTLEHGQTLGILGATGSGKTTVLNLLMRLYEADAGRILIDGQDIRAIDYDTLRSKFGVVFHAQADFIAEREGGMAAEVVVRGNNLSGGQKQRLLIARALAAEPEILVLDDASSALDYRTDAAFRKSLRENYRNTTTVLVTQRISSLCHADLILVLADGQVIGAGKHEDLMNTCEEYQLVAKTQMKE